jgi:outer membrane protein TolC
MKGGGNTSRRTVRVTALMLAVLGWFAWPRILLGQDVPLSLAQALDVAGQRNPGILAHRARTDAEAARAVGARRASWPRLSLATGWSRTDTPALVFAQMLNAGDFTQDDFAISRLNEPGALAHLTTTFIAEAPVDLFGKAKARAEAQSSNERAARAGADEALQDLRLRVVEAYRRAALAQRVVAVTARALASARAREADVEARVAEGAALRADLLRVRARRRQREADLAERSADAQIARAMLSRAMGADASVSYQPTEMPAAPALLKDAAASWATRAAAARPALSATRERLTSQKWLVRAEERANRPDLAAWGQVQDDRSRFSGGNRSSAFGVLLRWNAFDPGRGKRVAAAAAEARAAELDARAAADEVRLEVETAWQRAHAARERYAAAAGGAEEGREALRVVQERRQEGLTTLTDELETEAASLAAELEELRAASEAAIADAVLLRVAGAL